MLITVYCVRRDLTEITFSLDVDPDFELENFRALCELESGIPAAECQIVYAEQPLTDNQRSLSSYGLKDGDVVVLRQKNPPESRPAPAFPGLPRIDFSSIAVPGTSMPPAAPPQSQAQAPAPDSTSFPQGLDNPALLREMLLANPHELSLLKERNPPLAEALLSGDLERFTKVLQEQQQERARREQERIRLFSADPFDLEAQAKIEEDIRQQNIEENMTIAMEEAPESFGQVVMLYINCKVNGYPVKAFVDSGAQMTIMSQACAERCHIMRLVDRRWAGIAKGVGTQKIIGRVHLAQVQIEGDFLPCSFSILEEQPMDMLLGLDMLKRHQCSIDLEKNVLVIGTTGTRTSFLPEGELPECARLAYGPGTEDIRPEDMADRELAEVLQKSAEEADKESTSEAGPSLVPAMDGSTPPLPPAHPAPTRTPGTGSGDVPHEDVACSSSFHAGGGEVMADTSDPSDSTIAHDQGLAASLSPPLSVAGRGPEPALPAAEFTVTSDAGLVVHEESGSVPRPGDVSPHSISALEGDGGRDVTPAPGAITEDMMELDTQIIPDLHGCRPGVNVIVQNPESQNVSCNDLLTDPEKSEDADIVNKQDHLKPLSSSGQDGGDGCFSLAAALKELHKLLIISGQGSAQTGEDGALGSGDDRALGSEDDRALGSEDDRALGSGDDGALGSGDDRALGSEDDRALGSGDDGANVIQGTDQESGQNGDLDNDLHQEDGMSHPVTEETSPCIEADAPGDSFQVSSDCSGDFMESSAVMGSAPGQTLPGPVPDHDTITGVMGNSTDPAVSKQRPELSCDQGEAVGEGRSSVPPSDPPSPSDVERIVGAGFTAQDALVALERADGNVELALLTLLARNIVVPT